MGYYRSGFDVTGVDIKPQKRYPFNFIQADALEILKDVSFLRQFDCVHASPPCQKFSRASRINGVQDNYPDLIEEVRSRLKAVGVPYIIENVPLAPLVNYVELCGTMFQGLLVLRHRRFECFPEVYFPPLLCNCPKNAGIGTLKKYQSFKTHRWLCVAGNSFSAKDARIAMGIDWMTRDELKEAIPPAYTEWLGLQIKSKILNHAAHIQ